MDFEPQEAGAVVPQTARMERYSGWALLAARSLFVAVGTLLHRDCTFLFFNFYFGFIISVKKSVLDGPACDDGRAGW